MKQNILFICPPLPLNKKNIRPREIPLLLPYVAANVEKQGFKVEILDAFLLNLNLKEILKEVEKINPILIGIAPYDYSRETPIEVSLKIAKVLKNKFQHTIIGLLWSYNLKYFISLLENNLSLDYVVLGEPEVTMTEICKITESKWENQTLVNIKGIAFRDRKTNEVIINNPRELIADLDTLPFPARHLLALKDYMFVPHKYSSQNFITILTSRGCPNKCKFCFHDYFLHTYRVRSVENVIQEIEYVIKKYQVKEIHFEDPIFGIKKDWLNNFCKTLVKKKLNIKWACLQRVDRLDKDIIHNMAKAGCFRILFGVESANQKVLNIIDKKIKLFQVQNTVKWMRKAKIESIASFMLGLPGETPEMAKKTIEFVLKLNPDYIQVFLTKIYNDDLSLKKYGQLIEWDYSPFDFRGPAFIPTAYKNIEELKKLQKLTYLKFYLRPAFIINKLYKLTNFSELKRYIAGLRILVKLLFKNFS